MSQDVGVLIAAPLSSVKRVCLVAAEPEQTAHQEQAEGSTSLPQTSERKEDAQLPRGMMVCHTTLVRESPTNMTHPGSQGVTSSGSVLPGFLVRRHLSLAVFFISFQLPPPF